MSSSPRLDHYRKPCQAAWARKPESESRLKVLCMRLEFGSPALVAEARRELTQRLAGREYSAESAKVDLAILSRLVDSSWSAARKNLAQASRDLQQELQTAGLGVEIPSTSRPGDWVRARIRRLRKAGQVDDSALPWPMRPRGRRRSPAR